MSEPQVMNELDASHSSGMTLQRGESTLIGDLMLVWRQIGYEQRSYWRNRGRGVFTFVFPLMFLLIFGSLEHSQSVTSQGFKITADEFLVPGILAYGVIASTFINIGLGTAVLRDAGVLKRMQGTPLPRWVYIAARIGSTVLIVCAMTIVTLALGWILYGVEVRTATLPGLIVTLLIGTAALTTLGIGITQFIPNADSAPIVINMCVLPLTFISGIWFPIDGMSKVIKTIAGVFPIRPLAGSLEYAFNPHTAGPGFKGGYLLDLAIWTVVGCWLMWRFIREPMGD